MHTPVFYHYSENPSITLFEPRPGRQIVGRHANEQLVWTIDEHYSPAYFFPRECPRILLWPIEGSTHADIDRWIGQNGKSRARMVAHIERVWVDRFEACQLYRYTFDVDGFESLEDHGVHVNPKPVEPLDVTPVGQLRNALEDANVELRVMESLQPLSDAWFSTLHFSGIRLRNAVGWTPPE